MKEVFVKYDNLKNILSNYPKPVLAFSGGVDSTFLASVLKDLYKDKFLAIIAVSIIYPEEEIKNAIEWLKKEKINFKTIEYDPLQNPNFTSNPPDRCYHCKKELFTLLKNIARENGFITMLDGTNYDDISDYRPGIKALNELGVKSPLKEAKLIKKEIRFLSKEIYNLPTYNKVSTTCLATRIPYYSKIDKEKLEKLDRIESIIRNLGLKVFRARHHGEILRIEIEEDEFGKITSSENRNIIVNEGIKLGFKYITIDLEPFKSGNLHRKLKSV